MVETTLTGSRIEATKVNKVLSDDPHAEMLVLQVDLFSIFARISINPTASILSMRLNPCQLSSDLWHACPWCDANDASSSVRPIHIELPPNGACLELLRMLLQLGFRLLLLDCLNYFRQPLFATDTLPGWTAKIVMTFFNRQFYYSQEPFLDTPFHCQWCLASSRDSYTCGHVEDIS